MAFGDTGGEKIHLRIFLPKRILVSALTDAGAVGFQIRFVHDVNAPQIAQKIELGTIGIVGGADGVDIQFLHQAEILFHILQTNGGRRFRMEFVAVDALQLHGNTVDFEHLAIDGHLAEADLFHNLLAAGRQRHRVQFGILGRPRGDRIDYNRRAFPGADGDLLCLYLAKNVHGALIADGQNAVFPIDFGFQCIVRDVLVRPGKEIHIPEDAGKAELILALQIGGHAPFEDKDVQRVLSIHHQIGDIKLRGGVGNLGIPLLYAVDIEIEGRIHALKIQIILLAIPFAQ